MSDLFVSYKREDAGRVRKLVDALRQSGLTVWWDEDIAPSAPWETTIEQALAEAKAVIVCWSPAAVASENVRSEARVAREKGRLIQVFVRPCSPPLFFGERQGVDLANWRGKPDDARIAHIVQSVRGVSAGKSGEPAAAPAKIRRLANIRIPAIAAVLLLLLGSLAGWWLMSPAKAQGPMTLAVLPFRALNPADANLVDAIWDDTRGAIGRNPNLRVLGREALKTLADKDLSPADYRRKVGADYLLDGSVEHVGDKVQIKLNLTRTKDGTQVWSDTVGGKLDDVFAFQTKIANEVEGRIRGRVAPGGGAKVQNIATSGQVYSLYAEARAKVRKRDPDSSREGAAILRKALAMDPNYAPAWADLGVATLFGRDPQASVATTRQEAISYEKRALTLAPNLAYAHAALAMTQNLPPESEADLRRAVELDPGNADAWTWLGNLLESQNRLKESLEAQTRAVEIEPLWWTPVGNKIGVLCLLRDQAGLDRELERIRATQDAVLLGLANYKIAFLYGHPGDAVRILLNLRSNHPEAAAAVDQRINYPLLQLGFVDEFLRAGHRPPTLAAEFRGTPASSAQLHQRYPTPRDFWLDGEAVSMYSIMLPNHGRLNEWMALYKSAFHSPDDFMAMFDQRLQALLTIAPTVIANLRGAGDTEDADAILRRTEPIILQYAKNGPPSTILLEALAYYKAVEPNDDEAFDYLRRAVDQGALPDSSADIGEEPAFARLVKRQDFQALRRRVAARLAEERRKVDPVALANAGLRPSKLAA